MTTGFDVENSQFARAAGRLSAMARHGYLDHDGPIAFAHRGGDRAAPENTVAAFEHAVSLGYRYLETDVHRSADGVLVAFHDPDLQRTCGIDANIVDLTWKEISDLRVDGSEPIPRMVDLLERWPEHRFNIDCKSDEALDPLVRLVEEQQALDRICIGSFSLKRLRTLRQRLGSGLLTCMAPSETVSLRVAGWLPGRAQRAAQVPSRMSGIELVNERFIRNAHRTGVPVHVWTVNDSDEVGRLLDLGVDGIMTDDVEMLRDVYVERGIWNSTG